MVHFADALAWYSSPIVELTQVAEGTYRVRLACPEIARKYIPGQFVMVRVAGAVDPLIGRALAIFDRYAAADGSWEGIDVIFVAKGKFTSAVARMQVGRKLELWGPLGNGFSNEPVDHLILVAGGVGETPMLSYGQEALGKQRFGANRSHGYAKRVTLCYGARTSKYLACIEQFEKSGIDVVVSTDDGSRGHRQQVTASLRQVLDRSVDSCRIACCGPEPMMHAVSLIAEELGVPCQVSLETPMACGIGICFTCVAKIRDEQGWDYKRTCVEGPIFDACSIDWS